MNYSEALDYLYSRLPVFHHIGSDAYKPGLDNSIALMNALGNPQSSYATIHVGGTNGKGSVSHFLAAICQSAGYRVGLYTSPHLVDFGERIRVNGEMIKQEYVINFVANNKGLFNKIEPSFFEATMAMAFEYFAYCEVDIAIVEVGLGGRLDSTNIIQPILSVITNISFDHVGFLGDTLAKIAYEKAGIIKSKTPVIIGEWNEETRAVFLQKSLDEGADIHCIDESEFVYSDGLKDGKLVVKTYDNKSYLVGLSGVYQLKNVATVLKTIAVFNQIVSDVLSFSISNKQQISDEAIRIGLESVVELTGMRGRWEVLQHSPTIVFDTAHNVAGIKYVVEQLQTQHYSKLSIVIGMVNDKDVSSVLAILPREAMYYFTQASIARALSADELCKRAESYGLFGKSYSTVALAYGAARNEADSADLIFVGGSNFVVGEALAVS